MINLEARRKRKSSIAKSDAAVRENLTTFFDVMVVLVSEVTHRRTWETNSFHHLNYQMISNLTETAVHHKLLRTRTQTENEITNCLLFYGFREL